MDHLIDTDLSSEINAIWRTIQLPSLIIEAIDNCRKYELLTAIRIYDIRSPSWINRGFSICWRVKNYYDNNTELFCTNLTTGLQNALYVEMVDIYKRLRFQQKSVSCINMPDKHNHFLKSEIHLLLAFNLCKSHRINMIGKCCIEFQGVMTNALNPAP